VAKVYLKSFFAVLFLFIAFCPIGRAQGLAPGYQPIDSSDLVCRVRSSGTLAIVMGSPISGHVDEFSCAIAGHSPKDLDLASDRFENGFVKTKEFGDIQIFFIPGHEDVIAMKQDQKEKILKFIGK
jgi:hypothetical protein